MHVVDAAPLGAEEATRLDAYWRAANYLTVGQIYLLGNPLLREPLTPEQVKPRLSGRWGTTPGLNLLYAHLSRIVAARRQDLICVTGSGHGGPALAAHAWLEGTYSEAHPCVSLDERGMGRLFTRFAFPRGVPETPGPAHEGGELAHAFGAAFDNPDLVVACVVGDTEIGPPAAAWHANRFLDPAGDGAVLPILHLNDYRITNPAVPARIGDDELTASLTGYGYKPYLVEGDTPAVVHRRLAAAMDTVFDEIAEIQHAARVDGITGRPVWPMIVLRTPKGWTGPRETDRLPLSAARGDIGHLALLERWMRSYRPEELFDADGVPLPVVVGWLPRGDLRMSAKSHTNGGRRPQDLELPDFPGYGVRTGGRPGDADPLRVHLPGPAGASSAHHRHEMRR